MKVAPGRLKSQHETTIKPLPWIKARRQETIFRQMYFGLGGNQATEHWIGKGQEIVWG